MALRYISTYHLLDNVELGNIATAHPNNFAW